jgi:alpha-tubulin suppressor-like RCC1 family protein
VVGRPARALVRSLPAQVSMRLDHFNSAIWRPHRLSWRRSSLNPLDRVLTCLVAPVVLCASVLMTACRTPTGPDEGVLKVQTNELAVGATGICFLDGDGRAVCSGSHAGIFEPPTGSFVHLSAGSSLCGLTADGEAFCWGQNLYGEVGNGSVLPQSAPTPVASSHRFATIDAGSGHTCALTLRGVALCWGRNDVGAVGNGNWGEDELVRLPTPVNTDVRFRALATGSRSCAINAEGETLCWGGVAGSFGGDYEHPGDCDARYYASFDGAPCVTPTRVQSDVEFSTLAVGQSDCAVDPIGDVYCWGTGQYGTLGNGQWGSFVHAISPVRAVSSERFRTVTSGGGHVCALTRDDSAFCWGNNFVGQLGDGPEEGTGGAGVPISATPVPVSGDHRFSELQAAGGTTCGFTLERELYCWGAGYGHAPTRVSFF